MVDIGKDKQTNDDERYLIMFSKTLTAGAAMLMVSAVPGFAATQHDVAYYLAHGADRQAETSACANNPGDLGKTADCINAYAADKASVVSKL